MPKNTPAAYFGQHIRVLSRYAVYTKIGSRPIFRKSPERVKRMDALNKSRSDIHNPSHYVISEEA